MGGIGGLITAGLGIGSSIFGAMNAGSAQKSAAASARAEAAMARENAMTAFRRGNAQEEMQRRRNRSEMGNLNASLIENGLDLSSGTGANLVYDSAKNQELDALNIRHGAITQMNAYNQQGLIKDYEAATADAAAKQAQIAGWMNAAGSIVGGIGGMMGGGGLGSLFGGGSGSPTSGMSSAWGAPQSSGLSSTMFSPTSVRDIPYLKATSQSFSSSGSVPKSGSFRVKVRE